MNVDNSADVQWVILGKNSPTLIVSLGSARGRRRDRTVSTRRGVERAVVSRRVVVFHNPQPYHCGDDDSDLIFHGYMVELATESQRGGS